jgi:hypothetical protein
MRGETAKEISNVFGCLILVAAFPVWGATWGILRGGGAAFASLAFIILNPAFLLSNVGAVLLILKRPFGFICLYISILCGLFWMSGPLLPWLKYIFPAGPESEYYFKAANVAAILFLSYCHWKIASESEPRAAAAGRRLIIVFLILLVPSLVYWKTGIHIGNGEVQTAAQLPSIGPHLTSLESTQPILYRSIEFRRPPPISATVIFRGMSSEKNIREFAAAKSLKLMTNDSARVKFLPQARSWKLDPERFPVFTNETDLCYVGRIPTNSRSAFQLCFRPSDGRFTAMSMGNPNDARAASTAGPPQN